MKSKLKINVFESEILKSFHNQSEEETFEFVSKILNGCDHPHLTGRDLIKYLVNYVNDCVDADKDFTLRTTATEDGKLVVQSFTNQSPREYKESEAHKVEYKEV